MKLSIEKSIYGGAGLARADGKAVFVPFTLPGESVEAQITRDRGSFAEADLVSVLEPSQERVAALCRYFGECGGCHYQHASYAQQLEMKRLILQETLERARLSNLPEIKMLSGEPFHYRNRARFHLDRASSMLSYKKRASHANLPVDACPISAPEIEKTLEVLNAHGGQWKLAKHFNEVECFTNGSGFLLTFWTTQNAGAARSVLDDLWPKLRAELPGLHGVALYSAERENQRPKLLATAGEQRLTYRAAGDEYRVSVGSFFQVNRFLIDPLVELVTSEARGEIAWDLYAGVGLFARSLASRFEQVVAVESAQGSVQDLRHNLAGASHRVVAATTLDFLRRGRTAAKEHPDFVLVDPPRAGLGKEVTGLLGDLRPRNITYVSCDPATLSRDLKSLLDSGYSLKRIHMVDMFPQTFHLESVAMLSLM